MPLTTAEIYAKIGVEEGQPLHLLALICDDCARLEGYGTTHPDWVDGEFVATEYGRVLYVFTSAEKAAEFAKKTRGPIVTRHTPMWSSIGRTGERIPA
jgi:hypothetical protein